MNTNLQQQAINALMMINQVIQKIRLYPATNPMVKLSLERLHTSLREHLAQRGDAVTFAEAEKSLIVCGQVLDEREQQKAPNRAFLGILRDHQLRSISFEANLEKAELLDFLTLIATDVEPVAGHGDLKQALKARDFPHIHINQKIYVAKDGDQSIVADLTIKDEQIVRHLVGERQVTEEDIKRIREMATSPQWFEAVFKAGIDHLARHHGHKTDLQHPRQVVDMVQRVDALQKHLPRDLQNVRTLGRVLQQLDPEVLTGVIMLGTQDNQEPGLLQQTMSSLQSHPFYVKLQQALSSNERTVDVEAMYRAYLATMVRKGEERTRSDATPSVPSEPVISKKERAALLKEGLNRFMGGDASVLQDQRMRKQTAWAIDRLMGAGQHDSGRALLAQLGTHLVSGDTAVRAGAAECLAGISDAHFRGRQIAELKPILPQVLSWMQMENTVSPAWIQISQWMTRLARLALRQRQYAGCLPIANLFMQLSRSDSNKQADIQARAGELLGEIADEEAIEQVLDDFDGGECARNSQVASFLAVVGQQATEMLLDKLLVSENMRERSRIIRALSLIGKAALPPVLKRIEAGGEWYYLRNLVLILGRIGDGNHIHILAPLLAHGDTRVRKEALNTLYAIGGDGRGEFLLSLLSDAAEPFQPDIVQMLGALKYRGAVTPLLGLLSSKSLISSASQTHLKVKVCQALGRIGCPNAIPVLTEIRAPKKVFGMSAHHRQLRAAADKALAMIRELSGPVQGKR